MHWWARFIGLRVTVRLLSKLVVFPLVFQFIIWIGLVLIVWMRLELLIILEWLNGWLNLLEWIFVLFKIVLSSKFIMVHWRSIIAVVIWLTCVLSEWRLRCWFKALLMGIEFKFFVQASLVKVTRLSVTSLWHWFYSWLESRTIWVHHVCFRQCALHSWWWLPFALFNLVLLFLILRLFCALGCHWRLAVWFCILFLQGSLVLLLFSLCLFLLWDLLTRLFLLRFFIIGLLGILRILLLGCEFIGDVECINYFLPLYLIRQLLAHWNASLLSFLNVLSLLRWYYWSWLIGSFAFLLCLWWRLCWLRLAEWLTHLVCDLLLGLTIVRLFLWSYLLLILGFGLGFHVPFSLRLILQILNILFTLLLLIGLLLEYLLLINRVIARDWNLVLADLNVVLLALIWSLFAIALIILALIVFGLVTLSLRVVWLIFMSWELSFDKLIHGLLVVQIGFRLFALPSSCCLIALSRILRLSISYRSRWMTSAGVEGHGHDPNVGRLLWVSAFILIFGRALDTCICILVLSDQALRVVIVAEINWLTLLIFHSFILFLFQGQFSWLILICINLRWIFWCWQLLLITITCNGSLLNHLLLNGRALTLLNCLLLFLLLVILVLLIPLLLATLAASMPLLFLLVCILFGRVFSLALAGAMIIIGVFLSVFIRLTRYLISLILYLFFYLYVIILFLFILFVASYHLWIFHLQLVVFTVFSHILFWTHLSIILFVNTARRVVQHFLGTGLGIWINYLIMANLCIIIVILNILRFISNIAIQYLFLWLFHFWAIFPWVLDLWIIFLLFAGVGRLLMLTLLCMFYILMVSHIFIFGIGQNVFILLITLMICNINFILIINFGGS